MSGPKYSVSGTKLPALPKRSCAVCSVASFRQRLKNSVGENEEKFENGGNEKIIFLKPFILSRVRSRDEKEA